jgi:hypothetical protein
MMTILKGALMPLQRPALTLTAVFFLTAGLIASRPAAGQG